MAHATLVPPRKPIGSGLGRQLKGLASTMLLAGGLTFLSACAGMGGDMGAGNKTDEQQTAENGTVGPDGVRRGPRPNVSPIGSQGQPAYGAPRSGSGSGSGPVKIALLVPQSGRGKDLGNPLTDAAQMALFDTGRSDITLIIKDTSRGASSAAQSAINEGAEIILGPVFAEDVGPVRSVAASRGVPVIAFSSDSSVAGGGAYILSFPVEDEVRNVVNYSASRGYGLFATLTPTNTYGYRATAAFKRDVAATGGQIVASVDFNGPSYGPIMQLDGKDLDGIFLPAGNDNLRKMAGLLRFGPPAPPPPPKPAPLTPEEIAAGKVQPPPPPPPPPPPRANLPEYVLLGTGLWDEPANAKAGGLVNGIFAAPEPSTRERFASRFQGVYNYRPPRVASLGYDAVSLAATLSADLPGQRFTQSSITNPNGFAGVDGIFRFLSNGTIQRGLAIIQVTGGGMSVIRSAPRSFESVGY